MNDLNPIELIDLKQQIEAKILHLTQSITSGVNVINSIGGYFKNKLDKYLKSEIKVHCKANRGHSMVSSEVHKLFQSTTITSFTDLVVEQYILTGQPSTRKFGNNNGAQTLLGLMNLFSNMYKLATAARKLEEFEITKLGDLAEELGRYYPQQYPLRRITPKLHNLIYHIPQIAKKYKTVGLFGEHSIESLHHRINQYDSSIVV